jgi:hypothetical protein
VCHGKNVADNFVTKILLQSALSQKKSFLNSGKTSKDSFIPEQKQNKVCFAGIRFGFY